MLIFFAVVFLLCVAVIGRASVLDLREARAAGRTVLTIRQTIGRD